MSFSHCNICVQCYGMPITLICVYKALYCLSWQTYLQYEVNVLHLSMECWYSALVGTIHINFVTFLKCRLVIWLLTPIYTSEFTLDDIILEPFGKNQSPFIECVVVQQSVYDVRHRISPDGEDGLKCLWRLVLLLNL